MVAAAVVAATVAGLGWVTARAAVVSFKTLVAGRYRPRRRTRRHWSGVAVGWWRRRLALRCYGEELPCWLDGVARGLRSGVSLGRAMAEAAAEVGGVVGADVGWVVDRAEVGGGLVAALEGWARRRPRADVRLVVAALTLGIEAGGATARAVDGVARTLRQRLDARAEASTLATQGRVSALVLAAAPPGFGVVSMVVGGDAAAFLLGTGPGLACLAGGLALDGLGAWWMLRLARLPGVPP